MTKSCDETSHAETRRLLQQVNKKFKIYILLAVIYGLFFINYIDLFYSGHGYHLWLMAMYFFPFLALTILTFRRNIRLALALGLIASLMNDLFYYPVGYLFGVHSDLARYYTHWLIPSNTYLFDLNLGFATIRVFSWMMALVIYLRIALVCVTLRAWKIQADAKCINGKEVRKKTWLKFWDKIIERL